MSIFAFIFQLTENVVDVRVFQSMSDEDGDIRMGNSTGVSTSLDGEIFSRGKKYQVSNIGDSDNTRDGGKIVGRAIGACSGGIGNQNRQKDYAYQKEKMMLCKQEEKGMPLREEQGDWLADTDEEPDKQIESINGRKYILVNVDDYSRYTRTLKQIFLMVQMKEEPYVNQSDGFVDPDHPEKVYRLIKSLYGLKQAPRAWGSHATFQCQPMDQNTNSSSFDQSQPLQLSSKEINNDELKIMMQCYFERMNQSREQEKLLVEQELRQQEQTAQEKEGPPQDSDIRQLVREECCIENFRVVHKKSSIYLKNTSKISSVYAIAPILPNEELEYSFSMGYEHFSSTLVTELDKVTKSSTKNLVPIPREYKVTSDDESESNEPIKDDSFLAFTTFTNLLFNDKNDFTIHDEDVPIEESKVYSNPLFDDDEMNSDELESHVESNFVESLSNHDTLKFDHLEEFSGALVSIHITEEELIRKEYAEYISLIERLITINPCPCPTVNANTIVESLPSSLISVQDNDSQREEFDIATDTDELLPIGFENDDSKREIDVVEELRVDNSISNSENELSDNKASDFDNLTFPRPPSEPPVADFEPDAGEEISVVMNDNDELECLDPRDEIDVSTYNEDDDYFPFMFIIRIFLPYLIYSEVFPLLLSAESKDTIFDPSISV
nr:Gag-Pol polyprotein [Tanacetum cinerariifolium]